MFGGSQTRHCPLCGLLVETEAGRRAPAYPGYLLGELPGDLKEPQ